MERINEFQFILIKRTGIKKSSLQIRPIVSAKIDINIWTIDDVLNNVLSLRSIGRGTRRAPLRLTHMPHFHLVERSLSTDLVSKERRR